MPTGIYQHYLSQGFQKGNKINVGRKNSLGFHHSEKTNELISKNRKGKCVGKNHWRWIEDRSQTKQYWTERNNPEYKQWRDKVKKRDNYKCRMDNRDCFGYLVVHHILSWSNYPELRYNTKNGISLCQFHHPRKRVEERRLIPFFQGMVEVK